MRAFVGLLVVITFAGCSATGEVRYVYQDRDYGVVGLPENTNCWPTHYRDKAEALMVKHFPQGHEIVRAEEVVEGERQVKVEGSNTAEVAPQIPVALVNVARLGHSESRSLSDTVKLKECRIVYRRTSPATDSNGYATAAGLNPTEYIDPNAAERRKATGDDPSKTKKAGKS